MRQISLVFRHQFSQEDHDSPQTVFRRPRFEVNVLYDFYCTYGTIIFRIVNETKYSLVAITRFFFIPSRKGVKLAISKRIFYLPSTSTYLDSILIYINIIYVHTTILYYTKLCLIYNNNNI